MATCDAYYSFSMVDIGAGGANHDSAIFKARQLDSLLLSKKLCILPSKVLPGTNLKIHHYLDGDAAFPLEK